MAASYMKETGHNFVSESMAAWRQCDAAQGLADMPYVRIIMAIAALLVLAPDIVPAQSPQAGRDITISAAQRARLDAEVARLPADLRERFEKLYQDWKRAWQRFDISIRSDSAAVRDPEEFPALVALGPLILPLVVAKLMDRDEFHALQLYEVLQDRPDLQATGRFEDEQRRALEAAHRWLSR
jgi:hypothetical protein